MQYLTLDSIVRNVLLKTGKSSHYYLQHLSYACSALQKLNVTTMRAVNSVKLPVTSYKAIELPVDYIDWVQVGYQVGERVRPLIYDERLNRLNNFDSLGRKVVYDPVLPDGSDMSQPESGIDINGPIYDSTPYGTSVYNYDMGYPNVIINDIWKFKPIRERNEIQLSASYPYDFIILDYITDGRCLDSATSVNPLAVEAIEKYILWQYKLHSRSYNPGEAREAERLFYAEWRFLRASMFALDKDNIVHALKSRYLPYHQGVNAVSSTLPTLPTTAAISGTFISETGDTFISEDGSESFKTE